MGYNCTDRNRSVPIVGTGARSLVSEKRIWDRIIHRELSLLEYRFDGIDGGSEFIDPSHDYSFDLDLFGERSFFAYINRTATAVGRVALSRELLHPDLKTASIRERQEAVEEMSCHTDFRIDFQ